MFKRIIAAIRYEIQEESMQERSARMLPGALYGLLVASAYILSLSTVNVISLPGYHLAVDWGRLLTNWLGFGLALALAGAVVGWFTEDYQGVVGAGVMMAVLILAGNVIVALVGGSNTGTVVQSIVASLPLIGAAILITLALRGVINRHLSIASEKPPARRKMLAGLIGMIVAVGLFLGVLARFDHATVTTLETLNHSLQNGGSDPNAAARFPVVRTIPALKDHFGMDYRLYAYPSIIATGAMDISIHFTDGFSVTCLVQTDMGQQAFFTVCNEGGRLTTP